MKKKKKTEPTVERGETFAAVLHSKLALIEVAEPALLQEIEVDPRTGPFIVARLSDCVAVVAPGKANFLVKRLLKAGHTPKVIER